MSCDNVDLRRHLVDSVRLRRDDAHRCMRRRANGSAVGREVRCVTASPEPAACACTCTPNDSTDNGAAAPAAVRSRSWERTGDRARRWPDAGGGGDRRARRLWIGGEGLAHGPDRVLGRTRRPCRSTGGRAEQRGKGPCATLPRLRLSGEWLAGRSEFAPALRRSAFRRRSSTSCAVTAVPSVRWHRSSRRRAPGCTGPAAPSTKACLKESTRRRCRLRLCSMASGRGSCPPRQGYVRRPER